jgi:hypothetical protein
MLEVRNWKRAELDRVQWILRRLPERHLRYNRELSELLREEYLSSTEKTNLSAAGYYRTRRRSVALFNPAFWGPIRLGGKEVQALDFTLWSLIGFSLFTTLEAKKNWPSIMYPRFDRGSGARAALKVVDRELLPRELALHGGQLYLEPKLVSLDRSFAYCYASYGLAPENLVRSFPKAYDYLKIRIFAGREFRVKAARGALRLPIRA